MDRPLPHADPCPHCGGIPTRELIELTFTYPHVEIIAQGVPASVCSACGEQVISGDLGVWLSEEVAALAARLEEVLSGQEEVKNPTLRFGVDWDRLLESGKVRQLTFA